jgi:DNA-binding NarL/FixJ family response regulator
MEAIRVVLADDHPIMGAGMHILEEARHLFEDLAPDILLLEMTVTTEAVPPLERRPTLGLAAPHVFMVRGYQNHAYVFGLLAGEATAGLTERDALHIICEAVQMRLEDAASGRNQRIAAGDRENQLQLSSTPAANLTTREIEVLQQLTTGATDHDIGTRLGISKRTVRYHLQNIYAKLGVKQRGEAIVWAVQAGFGG